MTPPIPEYVNIIGKSYIVSMIDRPEGDYGECFSDQCRIEVAAYQCHEQRADTLLHEVMHGIDHEMHSNMAEAQIRRMSTGLLCVLRANPALVEFLLAHA